MRFYQLDDIPMPEAKTAELHRMVMTDHVCPYGLKSKDLLEREGFEIEDHHPEAREETDAFMVQHKVQSTPPTFIDGKRRHSALQGRSAEFSL